MKVLIGIIGNDAARFHLFTSSVLKLDIDGVEADVEMLIGGDWCGARNELVEMTLEGDYTHLWFMDDDHAFAPDLLKRLASHNVPLINPLCLARVAPFPLVTYALTEDGKAHLPIDLTGLPGEGLVEIHAGGCAGMLIRRDVLEAVVDNGRGGNGIPNVPPFEYGDRSEDVIFCEKARAAGFKLYADLGARLGHITTTVVYPDIDQGNWMTRLKIGGGLDLFVSPAQDWQAEAEHEAAEVELAVPDMITETVVQPAIDRSLFPPEEIPDPRNRDDNPHPDAELVSTPCDLCGAETAWTDRGRQGCSEHLPDNPAWGAERIEIWLDGDNHWQWRALGWEGEIVHHGSSIREEGAIGDAHRMFPDTPVHLIQREVDDSRTLQSYGPPVRLWNRGD
jgi:hypothetical protein